MGMCTRRNFLLSICVLQVLSIIERQVFDFLGYMWAPIFVNFFHIIFVIIGIFGTYQLRSKYILSYSIWTLIWIGWNAFLICFYMNAGVLDRNSDILNLGTGSFSWFEVNGFGCKPIYPTNITSEDIFRPVRPEKVESCLLEYEIIEVIHSVLQCFLAVLGLIGAIYIGQIFLEEDDDNSNRDNKLKKKHRQSIYSIEFSPPSDAIRGRDADDFSTYHQQHDHRGITELSPKPMTPRRVKRRSVMIRGTNNRQSTSSRRAHSSNRSSVRNSRRKIHQNPVTKIMEQQQNIKLGAYSGYKLPAEQPSSLTISNLKSLETDYVRPAAKNIVLYQKHSSPDPIYYNINASSPLMQQAWNMSESPTNREVSIPSAGHVNQSYQHSTPNLSHSPNPNDEPYNRPPSARSSYSNFHGSRPLSSYTTTTTPSENVFVQLRGSTYSKPQPIPQRRPPAPPVDSPEPMRIGKNEDGTNAFLNCGPPAYNFNYHTPPESETMM